MSETQALHREVAELKKEVAALRKKIDQMCTQIDQEMEYVYGYHHTLELLVLPMLIGHPRANWVQNLLAERHARYQELLAHPERAREGEIAERLSSSSKLYLALKEFGMWGDNSSSDVPDASQAQHIAAPKTG